MKANRSMSVVSAKGSIVIPRVLREKYGLKKGTQVHVIDYGGVLSIIPASDDPIKASHGMLRGGPSLVEALLKSRREDLERE